MAHYGRVFGESSIYIKNTLIYASLAGLIDVVVGGAIAYLVLRTKIVGRRWLDWAATSALAIPGVVLGIGYLRTFYGVTLPDGTPLATLVGHGRAGARHPPPALCTAGLLRRLAAGVGIAGGGAGKSRVPPSSGPSAASCCR
jgi:ABC-type Fe3+ transport system permease subunit